MCHNMSVTATSSRVHAGLCRTLIFSCSHEKPLGKYYYPKRGIEQYKIIGVQVECRRSLIRLHGGNTYTKLTITPP